MLDELIEDLSVNFNSKDVSVLETLIKDITAIACNISNRKESDIKLQPYIKKAVKSAYLKRGNEGMTSTGEGSLSYSYENEIEVLRNDIVKNGLRYII